jgi:hypothetical protein
MQSHRLSPFPEKCIQTQSETKILARAGFATAHREWVSKQTALEHDPEKCEAVFPRDKRQGRLGGDHAQSKS